MANRRSTRDWCVMYAFLVSTGIVAIGEIGDKTQLLAILLAVRFRRPWPIVLGILAATALNHAAAGALGAVVKDLISPDMLRIIVGVSFILIAGWALVPDRAGEHTAAAKSALAVFTTTALAFFLAEMGDKTQIATVMLAARFDNLFAVIAGTTTGMLLADIPAVFLANRMGERGPLRTIRWIAAALFMALGFWTLMAP